MLSSNGVWNWNWLRNVFPRDVLNRIIVVHPPRTDYGDDVFLWGGTNNGLFYAYNDFKIISNIRRQSDNDRWSIVWILKVAERVRVFVWLVHHNSIKNNQLINHIKLQDPYFSDCVGTVETTIHTL